MVMHARKQPRLNDGYADRKDTHLHKDLQYNSLFADDSDDDGPLGSRLSPRYQNKPSYIERNKEKRGSLSLAEKKVSHYLATGSLGRPIPMETSFSYSGTEHSELHHRSTPGHSSAGMRKERSGSQGERPGSGSREHNSHYGSKSQGGGVGGASSSVPSSSSSHQHHHHSSTEHGRGNSLQHRGGGDGGGEYSGQAQEKEVKATANNGKQSSSSGKEHGKDKEQVQKSAIRVCGDWSEHISSSGKRYYYNCKTEVSQWEKPKDWNSDMCKTPDHRSKDGRPRLLSQTPSNKINPENRSSRHSISSDQQQQQQQEHSRSHRVNSTDTDSSRDSQHQHSREASSATVRDSSASHQHNVRESRESRDSQYHGTARDNGSGPSRDAQYKAGLERARSGDSSSGQTTPSNSHHYHSHHGSHHQSSVTMSRSGSTPGNNGLPSDSMSEHRRQDAHTHSSYHQGDYKRTLSADASKRRRGDSQNSQRYYQDTGQAPIDDMDISPSPSPSPNSSRPSSSTGTPQLPPSSTPLSSSTTQVSHSISISSGQRSASPQGNPIPTLVNRQTVNEGASHDKTIQTLQELQKALSMSIHMAQQSTSRASVTQTPPSLRQASSAPVSSTHQMTPSQHLVYPASQSPIVASGLMPLPQGASVQHPYLPGQPQAGPVTGQSGEDAGGRASPVSETSTRSSCGSPTPSDSSSQNAAINSQALTAAAMKREETAKLTASLSNYYNEALIGHVLGWQADLVEKQASKFWEESMINGSFQCSQVSVQLKRARSQVRTAEIQSTVHEQRIMSSDQQRQEIENLKTPSSFLPS